MQIRSITNFTKRISFQSTCVKVRTSISAVVPVEQETTGDYYSEEFSIRGTSKSAPASCCASASKQSTSSESFSSSSSYQSDPHRMPIATAVVAHRRIYPAATTLAAGSQRSSSTVRLNALNILAPPKPIPKGPLIVGSLGIGRKSSKFAQTGATFTTLGGEIARGSSRPLLELKQLGAFLKSNGKGAVLVEPRRYYAKGKDKQKSKKTQVIVNEREMAEVIDVDKLKVQLGKVIVEMKEEYTKQLNVRGASGALESLEVQFDGEVYPLQELAQVGRKNPQLAVLNLASIPDAVKPVLQAIEESGMNLNPQQEGTTIYVPLPKVTREHRETLAKNAKALFTKHKVALQAVQNKFIRQCKNQKDLSDDLLFSVSQQIMRVSESYIAEAEQLMQLKQKELLETK